MAGALEPNLKSSIYANPSFQKALGVPGDSKPLSTTDKNISKNGKTTFHKNLSKTVNSVNQFHKKQNGSVDDSSCVQNNSQSRCVDIDLKSPHESNSIFASSISTSEDSIKMLNANHDAIYHQLDPNKALLKVVSNSNTRKTDKSSLKETKENITHQCKAFIGTYVSFRVNKAFTSTVLQGVDTTLKAYFNFNERNPSNL